MSAAVSVRVGADGRDREALTVADVRAWLGRWDQLTNLLGSWADDTVVSGATSATGTLLGMSAVIPPEPPE